MGDPRPDLSHPPAYRRAMPYAVRAMQGHGWLRELYNDRPIITAVEAEAQRFDDEHEARRVARAINRLGVLPMRPVRVDGAQTVYYEP